MWFVLILDSTFQNILCFLHLKEHSGQGSPEIYRLPPEMADLPTNMAFNFHEVF